MLERDIQRQCLDYLELKGFLHWRSNNIPVPLAGGGFRRFAGLKGVSDIIGMFPQEVTLEGGQKAKFGNLLAIEVKQPKKHPTPEQKAFLEQVNEGGGIGICVHSLEEMVEELERFM